MPAGSGPQVAYVTSFAMPADTAEHVVAAIPASSWANLLGNLVAFTALVTGAATGTLTLRMRQGTGITGTVIGAAVPLATAAAQVNTPSLAAVDASAFGQAQQGGQYVLTAQGSVNSIATLNTALIELETIAPVQ